MKLKVYNPTFISNLWLFLLTTSLFFPVRKVFNNPESNVFGFYSDFTTISLYSTTLIVLAGFLYAAAGGHIRKSKDQIPLYLLLAGVVILSLVYNRADIHGINFFYTGSLLTGIVLHATIVSLYEYINLNKFIQYFTFLIVIEAAISLFQFSQQSSLGLYKFGESVLNSTLPNIARILTEGIIFLRSYGSFPHPNVQSAFFVIGILFCAFLYTNVKKTELKYTLLIVSGGTLVGLLFTFSRAGILACIVSLGFLGLASIISRIHMKRVVIFGMFMLILSTSSVYTLRSLFLIRANVKDDAVSERAIYNNNAINMIKQSPIVGLGPGNSIIKIEEFSDVRLKSWEHQPIHNYFLLVSAEIGLFGAIAILALLFKPIINITQDLTRRANEKLVSDSKGILFVSILIGFFTLMFFDHYLYTLEQTRLLMWLLSGMSLGYSLNLKKETAK